MDAYDLIVIGSGPAGQRAAIQGAKSGKRVALVERREVVGGTCINTTMREAVLHLSGFQYQGIYGVSYRLKEQITMADLSFRVQQVIKNELDVTQAQLFRNGVTLLNGFASFSDRIRFVSREPAARPRVAPSPSSSPQAPNRPSPLACRSTVRRSS